MLLARDVRLRGFRLRPDVPVTGPADDSTAELPVTGNLVEEEEVDILLTTNLTSFLSSPHACHNFKILDVLASGRSTPLHCSTSASCRLMSLEVDPSPSRSSLAFTFRSALTRDSKMSWQVVWREMPETHLGRSWIQNGISAMLERTESGKERKEKWDVIKTKLHMNKNATFLCNEIVQQIKCRKYFPRKEMLQKHFQTFKRFAFTVNIFVKVRKGQHCSCCKTEKILHELWKHQFSF